MVKERKRTNYLLLVHHFFAIATPPLSFFCVFFFPLDGLELGRGLEILIFDSVT